ncbi:hypothetical protein K458DRAFT_480382 [Lentithecium fluviatile CBS 122367]|uniref:Myb-like domain-containing protein n=1 Tax=Lentithecium fluviatile CBS 122367 TaxID=1168545 RepID=A0A6G1IMZ2_9PLEO|nr:hypothetical protein K458DRAFT_480382 [Lentithecium fluviatile CBS 122367]
MEPRIATLLGDSTIERAIDPLLLLPPLPAAPRRPHPVEPGAVSHDARTNVTPRSSGYSPSQRPTKRQKTSVPIAGVLNNETPTPNTTQAIPASSGPLPPFSGRLSDLLLDPSQQPANKRTRVEEQTALPALENNPLTLPKPPQLPKKPTKRPRIPPLLQGLHQPPPLPEGRLFPPITGEGGGFGRNIGERVTLRSPIRAERTKDKENGDVLGTTTNPDITSEAREDSRREVARPTSRSASDKENQTSAGRGAASTKVAKAKETKKRNKWSEQETKDLLVGVSRFGIGNWKKILQCSDFTFNQRTAVDLKDRFRTCCPGEGLKLKKPKRKSASTDIGSQEDGTIASSSASNSQNTSSQNTRASEAPVTDTTSRKSRGETHKKGPLELAEMGIYGPFVRNKRRERREFTEKDDDNLLKGFGRYGSSWHSIRDDGDLGFTGRHPTDLRDRFRIRYPEMFAKAGYKLKPKDELILKEKEKEKGVAKSPESSALSASAGTSAPQEAKENVTGGARSTRHPRTASANPNLRPLALREPLHNSFPSPLEDFADLASEEDVDGGRSPIVLNRNIFEWADANPSSATSVTTANLPAVTSLTGESHLNFFNGTDGMHINPMATLNLPMALLTSSMLSVMPSHPPSANASSRAVVHHPHNGPTSSASTSGAPTSKQSIDPLLRTPNLPTIVFPHVPASSARSAVHNLPPPTDLLSGLEMDVRADTHTTGFLLDETIGFSLAANGALKERGTPKHHASNTIHRIPHQV